MLHALSPPLSWLRRVGVLGALALAACGSPQAAAPPPAGPIGAAVAGGPAWVMLGCAAHPNAPADAICGVGSVQATRNFDLARTAAQGRARTQIARELSIRIQAMLEDYRATVSDWEATDDEQNIVDVSRQVTDISLAGVRLLDAWVSPVDDTMHVLMILDFERVLAALGSADGLSPTVRAAIQQRASDARQRMDRELSP
jgi:hypothetical protein